MPVFHHDSLKSHKYIDSNIICKNIVVKIKVRQTLCALGQMFVPLFFRTHLSMNTLSFHLKKMEYIHLTLFANQGTIKHKKKTLSYHNTKTYQRRSWTPLIRLCSEVNTSLIPKYIEYATDKQRVLPWKKFTVNQFQEITFPVLPVIVPEYKFQ